MFFFDFNEGKDGIPGFEQMMKPVLAALQKCGGRASIAELDKTAIEIMDLPDELTEIIHKGATNRSEVSYRLAWARTYLKKYGLIENEARGIWILTDQFDGDIDKINPDEIIRKVRNFSQKDDRNVKYSTVFESAQTFENMIDSLLKEISALEDKKMIVCADSSEVGIDFILPDGIGQYEYPLKCIVKYASTQNQNSAMRIKEILGDIKKRFENDHVLLIINFSLPKEFKNQFYEKVIIWDREELSGRIDPDAAYAQYFINPKQALIEDLVTLDTSREERNREKENYISNVKTAFRNEDMILFLGAGVSIDGGIPLWSTLIKQLHIHMINRLTKTKNLSYEEQRLMNELAFDNKMDSPLLQMRYIKSAFSNDEYYQLVHSALYGRGTNADTKLLNAIAKICTPQRAYCGIKSVITYNFDDLLESKFEDKDVRFNVVSGEEHRQQFDKLNIYHVHGYLPSDMEKITDDTNLVFSEEDYHKVYRDAYSWSNLAQLNALRESTCLFIGCSLTDPNVRRLLDVASRNGETPRHFAFMKKNRIEDSNNVTKKNKDILNIYKRIDDNIQTGYYRELGLNIIWVDEFEEIPEILDSLIE